MNLSKSEKEFLTRYREQLRTIFQKRVADLKEDVFKMPRGRDRDYMIDFIDEMQVLINNILQPDEPKRDGKEYI